MTQDDIIRMAGGYTPVEPRWYESLQVGDFVADKETHDVAVVVDIHQQRPIAPDYYFLNFADGSRTDVTDNEMSAAYRPYVLISRIAAAPDLLEALELADAMLSGANMNASVVERKVRAAIAKARGEK